MAVLYELVVNLGRDRERLEAAQRAFASRSVEIRGSRLPLVARVTDQDDYIELALVVPEIGIDAPPCLLPFDPRSVTDAEMSSIGEQLLELLAELEAFDAAAVGWDPEGLADVGDLQGDLERGDEMIPGVVIAAHLAEGLVFEEPLESFGPNHLWIPYRGDRSL